MRQTMMKNWVVMAAAVMMLVWSSGCAMKHQPVAEPMDSGAVPQLAGKGSISIVNTQMDKTEKDLGRAGMGVLRGDLHTWSEAAIALLKTEAAKGGLQIKEDGEKTLKLAVTEVSLGVTGIDFVAAMPKGKVTITVETGDGYTAQFVGEKHSLPPPSACEKALTEAIVAMLRDEKIVAYLQK